MSRFGHKVEGIKENEYECYIEIVCDSQSQTIKFIFNKTSSLRCLEIVSSCEKTLGSYVFYYETCQKWVEYEWEQSSWTDVCCGCGAKIFTKDQIKEIAHLYDLTTSLECIYKFLWDSYV